MFKEEGADQNGPFFFLTSTDHEQIHFRKEGKALFQIGH